MPSVMARPYSDDFTLIVPENTDVSAEDEMRNVLLWSDDNKLSVNFSKCKEIVTLVKLAQRPTSNFQ